MILVFKNSKLFLNFPKRLPEIMNKFPCSLMYRNNCLFDATIAALHQLGLRIIIKTDVAKRSKLYTLGKQTLPVLFPYHEVSADLRHASNYILRNEGLSGSPNGEPAGGEYIMALSKLLKIQFDVHSETLVGTKSVPIVMRVKHETTPANAITIAIKHLKHPTKDRSIDGHWIAISNK